MVNGLFRSSMHFINNLHEVIGPPVLVLLYHRVTNLSHDPQQLAVSPDNFRRQMDYLVENYKICRFEGDWSGHDVPKVAVTFDDGYADNLLEVLPILRDYNVPATVFVATGAIESKECFWWDKLAAAVLESRATSPFTLEDQEYGGQWSASGEDEKARLYWLLHERMLGLQKERRDNWLLQLMSWAGVANEDLENHRLMTPQQVKALASDPLITIGAHGQSHTRLSLLPPAEQEYEINESRVRLEGWIGREVEVFSYPFGTARDFSRVTVEICRKVGFRRVAANRHGCWRRLSNPFRTPRCLVRDWNLNEFSGYLKSCWKE